MSGEFGGKGGFISCSWDAAYYTDFQCREPFSTLQRSRQVDGKILTPLDLGAQQASKKERRMSETNIPPSDAPRQFRFDWLLRGIFKPKALFQKIANQTESVWLTPLLLLTVIGIAQVLVAGWVNGLASSGGEVSLPPGFEYYTPEQQAQFQQALQATSGPVFRYVFPALGVILQTWLGWLAVSSLLHLVLTLLGGRGDMRSASNMVAWASLPLVVRDLVRIIALLVTKQPITSPGLAGFAPPGTELLPLFLAAVFALVDIYLFWHILLLTLAARQDNGLSLVKATSGVLVTILLALLAQAALGFAAGRLSNLTVIRPFF
jgi:hypothetical protein